MQLPDIGRYLALIIAFIRFCLIFSLLFLLLKPALSLVRHSRIKPLLIVAQDNSASLLNSKDSLYFRTEYGESLRSDIAGLTDKFTVEWLTFGKSVRKNPESDFSENYTDIAALFDYIQHNYISRRPEALVLLSDGIYNSGVNPLYKAGNYPVYTVGLGDTVRMPDVYIKSLDCNKFNFIRTVFPIKAEVAAVKQKGKNVKCVLRENGKILEERFLTVTGDNFLQEVVFYVEALRKGTAKYTLELETGYEERSRNNNSETVYTDIIDNTGEVVVGYSVPHPDVAAITEALKTSGVFKCTVFRLGKALPAGSDPVLFILHNPRPDDRAYQQIVAEARKKKTAVWYILTDRKSITDFARYDKTYVTDLSTEMNEYASAALDRYFPYFEFSEEEIKGMEAYPPLVVPFGDIRENSGKVLLRQKIKNTVTENGIMSFYDKPGNRECFFRGEGLWKWRLFSYKESGSHDLFNTLIYKTVNYLTARKGNERFLCDISSVYDETEDISVRVELYNDSYEPVSTPDVKLKLKYGEKEFNYSMNRDGEKYRLDLGNLPSGDYNYRFATEYKGEHFGKTGTFYVRARNSEANDVVADQELLKEVARRSGGKYVRWQEKKELWQTLARERSFKPESRQEVKYMELGELKGLGIILLILLCLEWFLLKYFAG